MAGETRYLGSCEGALFHAALRSSNGLLFRNGVGSCEWTLFCADGTLARVAQK